MPEERLRVGKRTLIRATAPVLLASTVIAWLLGDAAASFYAVQFGPEPHMVSFNHPVMRAGDWAGAVSGLLAGAL